MFNIFNMGIGMVLAMKPEDAAKAIELLRASDIDAKEIGKVTVGANINIKPLK
jgi:AIR synthase related protein, C-terminal domain